MKIQEVLSGAEPCDDVPRLDLTALTENNSWTGQSFFLNVFFFHSRSAHGRQLQTWLVPLCRRRSYKVTLQRRRRLGMCFFTATQPGEIIALPQLGDVMMFNAFLCARFLKV